MRIILPVAAALLAAAPAFAQSEDSRFQASIGYGTIDGDAYTFDAVTGRLGGKFNDYFGVEGEASIGVSEESFDASIGGSSGTIEHKYDAAIYAVGHWPISDRLQLFARLGYGTSEVESSEPSVSVTQTGDSVNYGVGATYYVLGDTGLRADWTRRDMQDQGGEVDVWSLSLVRRF
jgi:outer membrane immunogenic protein